MTSLTIQDVTNLYLYKEKTLPENRLDASLITKVINEEDNEKIDKKEFMSGPGRFVTADDFTVVKQFFTSVDKRDLVKGL
ncbi:hypothetical protein RYD26_12610, partial [Pasteurellaceae bacterium LIM206]|nr:hypothetical protein [Pasteurellaceae bacterium LIM206]